MCDGHSVDQTRRLMAIRARRLRKGFDQTKEVLGIGRGESHSDCTGGPEKRHRPESGELHGRRGARLGLRT